MQSGDAESMSDGNEGCDITECSDADFDDWFETQKPNLDAANKDYEHKRFNAEMMHAWMMLTMAATEAIVEFADKTYLQSKPEVPEPPMPRFAVLGPYIDYDEEATMYYEQQAEIISNRDKAKKLLARARRVQNKISLM
tara:strand:+ start:10787 stop:11203 length:417 start_codon:yes stop_codon:yes gene_type:complete